MKWILAVLLMLAPCCSGPARNTPDDTLGPPRHGPAPEPEGEMCLEPPSEEPAPEPCE